MSEPSTVRTGIWGPPQQAAHGPVPTLTRTQIAIAAIEIADTEGIDAVLMRRIAHALAVGTASLYRYVDSKDELLDLMIDQAEGEDGPPPPLLHRWREDLVVAAVHARQTFLRQPWMTAIAASRPALGPGALRRVEFALAALDVPGADTKSTLTAVAVVTSFVRGYVIRELAEQQMLRRSGLDQQTWAGNVAPYLTALAITGRYPRFTTLARNPVISHELDPEADFATALNIVLDGIAPTL